MLSTGNLPEGDSHRNSVDKITDHPDMTSAVYRGRKASTQTKKTTTKHKAGVSQHYDNAPMQYTTIVHGYKNDNFQVKNYNIFLIFAQNIDCGYT